MFPPPLKKKQQQQQQNKTKQVVLYKDHVFLHDVDK